MRIVDDDLDRRQRLGDAPSFLWLAAKEGVRFADAREAAQTSLKGVALSFGLEEAAAARGVGPHVLLAVLAGLWWGAASHTLTDVFWTVVRKGSEIF